jgi:predicted nuclease of predicted toxin-antitoxin system
MIRLLTDENFNQRILRGLHRRLPRLDFVSVRDVGLAGSPDLVLLKWAAKEQRTILTRDIKTLVPDANQLMAQGEPMAGVIVICKNVAIGHVINDLELLLECHSELDMRNHIEYVPL